MSSYIISLIRTGVPALVGWLLTLLAETTHIVIDANSQASLVALCVAVLTAAYYALARLLEKYVPALGFLLGVPAQPSYPAATKENI